MRYQVELDLREWIAVAEILKDARERLGGKARIYISTVVEEAVERLVLIEETRRELLDRPGGGGLTRDMFLLKGDHNG